MAADAADHEKNHSLLCTMYHGTTRGQGTTQVAYILFPLLAGRTVTKILIPREQRKINDHSSPSSVDTRYE